MEWLTIQGLEYAHGVQMILPKLSLTAKQGDFVCLLGPSGSGKTTLLRLIAGLERVQKGRIMLNHAIVSDEKTHMAAHLRGVGMVFQQPTLFPTLTVMENVCFGIRTQSAPLQRKRAESLLEHVGLAGLGGRYPHQLSGGQQHRVALARALAPKPGLLLLDEPFAHLDTALRVQLRRDTLVLVKEEGVSCVMVTHDPQEAMMMGDQLVLLDATGHIRQSGSAHDVYYHPVDAYVAQALGEMNVLAATIERGQVRSPLGGFVFDSDRAGKVLVGIRPQDCVLSQSDGIAAQVLQVIHGGAQDYIELQLEDGSPLQVSLSHEHHWRSGDHAFVQARSDRFHLFDAVA